jgi:pteridine reductase
VRLEGKVVLVTGAGRRVGRAIAEYLASDGARVAVHYHASAADATELVATIARGDSSRAEGFAADLRDARAAEELPARVLARMGRLDVLVNSAAVMLRQPFGEVTAEQWDEVMSINLRSAFFVSQGAAPALRAARGKILNISDLAALEPWPSYLPHSISKAGIEMLTRGLARILAPDVTVNAIAPGPVMLPEGWSKEATEETIRTTPVGRLGTPADVAAAVRFLLDADYTTGTTLVVDGGRMTR